MDEWNAIHRIKEPRIGALAVRLRLPLQRKLGREQGVAQQCKTNRITVRDLTNDYVGAQKVRHLPCIAK